MARRMNCLHARGLAQYVLTSYEVAQGPPRCSPLGSATLLSLQVARVSGPVRAARLCLPQLGSLVARSCVCIPALPPHEGVARGQQHSTRNQLCSPTKVARINGTVAVLPTSVGENKENKPDCQDKLKEKLSPLVCDELALRVYSSAFHRTPSLFHPPSWYHHSLREWTIPPGVLTSKGYG